MNMWIVTGIVVFKGQKRNERAPWPCIVESDGGSKEDPTTRVPVDIFGDVEVGQRVGILLAGGHEVLQVFVFLGQPHVAGLVGNHRGVGD